MDGDGILLRNENGDITWKNFPSTNNGHVFEDKDHAE